MDPGETIERERRWARPAALAALGAVSLVVVSVVLTATSLGSEGDADALRTIDESSGTLLLIHLLRAAGLALLIVPLVYLFRAAQARSDAVRGQLIGLVVAGPLFLAGFVIFDALSLTDAATAFVKDGIAGNGERADELARDAIKDASLRDFAAGLGFAGTLGFAFAMAYTCLHAMRVGLLSRLWGSLGIALGVTSFLLLQYATLWFIYLGLLLAGWLPRGRPPAWAAGETVAWPTPGERAAESLAAGETDADAPADADEEQATASTPAGGPKRKRKRRR